MLLYILRARWLVFTLCCLLHAKGKIPQNNNTQFPLEILHYITQFASEKDLKQWALVSHFFYTEIAKNSTYFCVNINCALKQHSNRFSLLKLLNDYPKLSHLDIHVHKEYKIVPKFSPSEERPSLGLILSKINVSDSYEVIHKMSPFIEKLTFQKCHLPPLAFSHFENLTELIVDNCTSNYFIYLKRPPKKLKRLHILNSKDIRDVDILSMQTLQHLDVFELSHCPHLTYNSIHYLLKQIFEVEVWNLDRTLHFDTLKIYQTKDRFIFEVDGETLCWISF